MASERDPEPTERHAASAEPGAGAHEPGPSRSEARRADPGAIPGDPWPDGGPILCLVGPTAVGKTAVAIALCQRFGAEIVGADASQVYRGLDIGTGKATAAELGGVAHHLLDVVPPDGPFDAGDYVRHADAAIADIRRRGRRVVVCGGTGLYLRALLHGLAPTPPVDAAVRAALRARVAAGEAPALHRRLAEVDPAAAARIQPQDGQRIERALAVFESTGRPLSAWQAAHAFAPVRWPHAWLGLDLERSALAARIDARVAGMFAAGFPDEVARLLAAGQGPALQSMGALGYRILAEVLGATEPGTPARASALQAALVRVQAANRQYARRQRTWFRAIEGVPWFAPGRPGSVAWSALDAYVARLWPTP